MNAITHRIPGYGYSRSALKGLVPLSELTARTLDRLSDCELQHGHHARAEQLAHLAAEMREAGR